MKPFSTHLKPLFLLVCLTFSFQNLFAQLEFKLQWMEAEDQWGVFVRPNDSIDPSDNIVTGSGQVTLVAPLDFVLKNLEDVHGNWDDNALIISPPENPDFQYLSFGLISNNPPIKYASGLETLLFTFQNEGDCVDTLHLIDNATDPFIPENSLFPGCGQNSNSACNNPGMDLFCFDAGNSGQVYNYSEHYDIEAWNCNVPSGSSENSYFQSLEQNDLSILSKPKKKVRNFHEYLPYLNASNTEINTIRIFPNPFHNALKIQVPTEWKNKNLTIEFLDAKGIQVKQISLIETNEIQVEDNFDEGFYFFLIKDQFGKILDSGKLLKCN